MHKKYCGFVSALLFIVLIFSCSQQPIFWAIAQEIKLLDPSLKGNVHAVVRCDTALYAANGNVYRKPLKSERGWQKIASPAGNAAYLAASNTHVYALIAKGENCSVYVLPASGDSWQEVAGTSGKANEVVIFDNGVSGTGRNAYVRVGGSVYGLTGVTKGAAATSNGAGGSTLAAAAIGSTDHFANTRAFCSDGTKLYMADGTKIKTGITHATLTDSSVSTSEKVIGLAYVAGESRLVAGTKKGAEEIKLTSGTPQSAGLLGANAEAAFGESEVFSVACFGSDDNNTVYAGVGKAASNKYNALWGYYPARGNWNYE